MQTEGPGSPKGGKLLTWNCRLICWQLLAKGISVYG